MMKQAFILLLLLCTAKTYALAPLTLFKADDARFQYIGRVDFTNPMKPRFWSPGVYITARFKGTACTLLVNDEVMYGSVHNYIEVVVDGIPTRLQTTANINEIVIANNLPDAEHTVVICKDTEAGLGYLEFLGLKCEALLTPPALPSRRIEYMGDSITAGTGMDESAVPCGKGQWYDQHNSYMSYGARTSRALNAQWQLTAVAGIGMVHSCCNMDILFPQVYDKVSLRNDSLQWDFKHYQADVVTICLGQNDGTQDYEKFGAAYIKLIAAVRGKYPNASIICLSSPMADAHLTEVLKKHLTRIVRTVNMRGDKKVSKFFFSRSFNSGCDGHPDINEHDLIAAELTNYIKILKGW